jgi:hypothetical protein
VQVITYTQLGNFGRLGNQLFQYAALRSVSLETGYEMKIPDPAAAAWQNQRCQLTEFNIGCDFLTDEDYRSLKFRFTEPHHAAYWPQVFQIGDNTDLAGYFQNYQYFAKHEKTVRTDLQLKGELDEYAEEYLANLKTGNEKIVSVHFRRGDLTDGTNPDYANYYGPADTLSEESIFGRYFFKAIEQFDNINCRFLVFSGGSRAGMKNNQTDIAWCKQNLDEDKFLFCEEQTDIQDFAIMKNCDHHITTHMTSFGYWAAFLNEKEGKRVIAPKNYTVPDDGRVEKGFYPGRWKLV